MRRRRRLATLGRHLRSQEIGIRSGAVAYLRLQTLCVGTPSDPQLTTVTFHDSHLRIRDGESERPSGIAGAKICPSDQCRRCHQGGVSSAVTPRDIVGPAENAPVRFEQGSGKPSRGGQVMTIGAPGGSRIVALVRHVDPIQLDPSP